VKGNGKNRFLVFGLHQGSLLSGVETGFNCQGLTAGSAQAQAVAA
jgi:hypothetical protein